MRKTLLCGPMGCLARRVLIAYRLTWLIVAPLILLWSLQQAWTRSGGISYLRQRFGLCRIDAAQAPVWFHAASVGEVQLVAPLIAATLQNGVLLTCNTPDAHRLAQEIWGIRLTIRYCPLDFVWSVKALLRAYQPKCLFVAETEIWPELYRQCRNAKVPIHIVSGRISDKTYHAAFPIRVFLKNALENVTMVWARSDVECQRFIDLGCAADRVENSGSLKMGRIILDAPPDHPMDGRPYSLAVSTHPNEDMIVARAWRESADTHLLVVIPRHPQRGFAIAALLEAEGFIVARRSDTYRPTLDTEIYIADTIGEVDAFCAHAELVFVGGSMVPHGGHNVFEAAARGKPVIVGHHTHNFADEVAYLRDRDAIQIVSTETELAAQWRRTKSDDTYRSALIAATKKAYAELPDREAEYIARVRHAIKEHFAV